MPKDLEEDIPANGHVRVVNAAVNRLDDAIFDAAYPGGGRDSYHPKMLTKIIIDAYTQRIYSSRQIAKAVREKHHVHVDCGQAKTGLPHHQPVSFGTHENRTGDRVYSSSSISD